MEVCSCGVMRSNNTPAQVAEILALFDIECQFDTIHLFQEEGLLVALGDRKVQTGVRPGMEHKLQHVIAGVSILSPHVESKTHLELTRCESNRDEWG